MLNGKLETIRKRHREFGYIFQYKADAELAQQLPALPVPRMSDVARAAFRAVMDYEVPSANMCLFDVLGLAAARGFCAHPCDWVPNPKDSNYMALYQPWSDWLSEKGLSPFHEGNTLTSGNWRRWKPAPRLRVFKKLMVQDPHAALQLLKVIAPTEPAAVRFDLLNEVSATPSFAGNYPSHVPILKFFQADRSAKIRAEADAKLKQMGGLVTEEAHAMELAKHLAVIDGRVRYKVAPEPHTFPFWENYRCTTFDLLAKAMGLHSHDLAQCCDLKGLGTNFEFLAVTTGDVDVRSIMAARTLDVFPPDETQFGFFRGVARPLWERGLQRTFKSNYWHIVGEYLGLDTGTLGMSQMRELSCFEFWEQSVVADIEKGELPVNTSYDPIRALGLVVDKDAARFILERAIALGMKADHPRLTMLKFNLAL